MTLYTGTSGNDSLVGTSAADIFDMSQGGRDTVAGVDDNDTFLFGGTLTAKDSIDGGAGADTLELDGDYSAGLTLKAATLANVEFLRLDAGHDYNITANE